MDGRTQLIIDGVEVVLPQGFATTVKRENSFFTKNGEYTYDCSLSLDNDTNRRLYGFLQRLNKTEAVRTKRSAVIIADGKVYCRGTEVITGWTDEEVSVQVVSGNSELNYFIGDSLKIEFLDMGEIQGDIITPFTQANIGSNPTYPDVDYCLPTIFNKTADEFYNVYVSRGLYGEAMPKIVEYTGDPISRSDGSGKVDNLPVRQELRPQPFLCALIRRLMSALGYTINENQLENTIFRRLFIVNMTATKKYAEMLRGWTVKNFLEEVEKLCNICFVVDNVNREVNIYQKSSYYASCRVVPLQNVVDEYTMEVQEDADEEWSASDIAYELPDEGDYRKLRLDEDLKKAATTETYDSFPFPGRTFGVNGAHKFYKNSTNGRLYIMRPVPRDTDYIKANYKDILLWATMKVEGSFPNPWIAVLDSTGFAPFAHSWEELYDMQRDGRQREYANTPTHEEVDLFADLKRDDASGTLELGIKPADVALMPGYMYWKTFSNGGDTGPCLRPGLQNIISVGTIGDNTTETSESEESSVEDTGTFGDYIMNYTSKSDSSPVELFCAFYGGLQQHRHSYLPQAYTDAYHAQTVDEYWHTKEDNYALSIETDNFEGSLRLTDLDEEVYGGVYRVDITRQVTFETYDPNLADPRAVYVIRNRRYVCRDIEETITAKGRKPRWKMTCHPIELSDTAAESRWVLTRGVWDDGGAWLDDGRWLD